MPTETGPLILEVLDANNNSEAMILTLRHKTTTGTPGNGIGSLLVFEAENSANEDVSAGELSAILTDVTDGAEDGDLVLRTRSGGSLAERWRVKDSGILEANGAQTLRTSTGNLTLATNAGNGNIIVSPNGTGKVGIGTTAPAEMLHVFEASTRTAIQYGSYGGLGTLHSSAATVLGNNVKPAPEGTNAMQIITTHASLGGRAIRMGSDNGITFHGLTGSVTAGDTFTSELMRITNTGNVGIGQTTPTFKLHVEHSTNAGAGAFVRNLNTGTSAFGRIIASSAVGGIGMNAYSAAHSVWPNTALISSDPGFTNGLGISTNGANPLRFMVNFVEKMRVHTDGNVGIGTTTPSKRLHVALDASGGADLLALENASDAGADTKYAGCVFIGTDTGGAKKEAAYIRARPEGADYEDAYLSFWTRASDTTPTEKWQITSSGILQAMGGDQTIRSNTGDLTLATAADNGNIYLDPHGTGMVSIGEASPTNLLHVSKSACDGIDLIGVENTSAGDCEDKFAGIAFRGQDTGGNRKETGHLRIYPEDSNYEASRFGLWARANDQALQRAVLGAGKTLIDNSAVSLFEIALPVGSMTGGTILAAIEASDGTNHQTLSQMITFAAVHETGGYGIVETVNASNSAEASPTGSLSATWGMVSGSDKVTMRVTSNSSLTPTVHRITYTVFNHGQQALTIL